MVPRTAAARSATSGGNSPGLKLTGAMTKVIELTSNAEELRRYKAIFDALLGGRIGSHATTLLMWILGIDGDEIHVRDIHQATHHFDIDSIDLAIRQFEDATKELRRFAKLPDKVTLNQLRHELSAIATQAKSSRTPAAAPRPRGDSSREQQRLQNIATHLNAAASTNGQRRVIQDFLNAVAQAGRGGQAICHELGIDEVMQVKPRKLGAVVARCKYKNEDDARTAMDRGWEQMHRQFGLPSEVDRQWVLDLLAGRLTAAPGHQNPGPTPTRPAPDNPAPTAVPVPVKLVSVPNSAPTSSNGNAPTDADRDYFLASCADDDERRLLTFIYANLGDIKEHYRPYFIENYGLIRGKPPVSGKKISQRLNLSGGWLSVGTNGNWQHWRYRFERTNPRLASELNGRTLFILMCRLHGVSHRTGLPFDPTDPRKPHNGTMHLIAGPGELPHRIQPASTAPLENGQTDLTSGPIPEEYSEIIALAAAKYQPELMTLVRLLPRLRPDDRRQIEALFGLRNGTRPMGHEAYAQLINIKESACSQRTVHIFERMYALGLPADITSGKVRGITLSIHGIRQRGTLFLHDAGRVEVPAPTAPPAPTAVSRSDLNPSRSRDPIGARPLIAAALEHQEGLRSFFLAAARLCSREEMDLLRLYYIHFQSMSTIASKFGGDIEDAWSMLRGIWRKLGVADPTDRKE